MGLSDARLEPFSIEFSARLPTRIKRFSHLGPLRVKGRTRTPSLRSTTTPSGASVLQVHFALWHSTSASGPSRRIPPPRGSPPRCPSRAFPSTTASSSPSFFYEAFPHSEVRCLWTIIWCGPLSLLQCVLVPCVAPLYAVGTSSGADGRASRLRSSSPMAIVFGMPSFLCTCSTESLRTVAVGRVSRPRSSIWRSPLFSISFLFLFACSRIACSCSLIF